MSPGAIRAAGRLERRPDLPTGDYRVSLAGKYVIVYRLAGSDGVEIVRVLHGAREWEKIL